ncbi:MAG: BMP family ABC transporter substrate-binding protein [Clostridia bacterium]|nr:BMP family ABC transporter substrate-binding protein [Clostridia bacterium]
MITAGIKEEYLRAAKLGQKEKKELEAAGRDPYPKVLDELLPDASRLTTTELPVMEIPADRIVGTRSGGRVSVFSASFLPLPDVASEFAAKWMNLLSEQLSETGIRDPIDCFEYLGDFYVQEGNKRASVLKYLGAVRIPARVRRILPAADDPAAAVYGEFLDFFRRTGSYEIQFKKPGGYAKLLSAMGKKPDEGLSETEVKRLISAFCAFKKEFASLTGARSGLIPEDALLVFLKVHTYDRFVSMSPEELKKALSQLFDDVKAASEPEAITLRTAPAEEERKSVIGKLISGAPKHLEAVFICQRTPDESPWTRGHAEGAAYLQKALPDSVSVKCLFGADTDEKAEALMDEAAAEGAGLIFTTTPPLITATLKAAVRHPKVRFFNCSACQPLSSVKSYYCRTYEGKFITGMIAGALAENDLIGYVGSYPILGVPAAINAFAIGARMTNPRARVLLEWTCTEIDCIGKLRGQGVRVISNRDIPLPDVNLMREGAYGTFIIDASGGLVPIASPCWMWGKLYENIARTVLSGSLEGGGRAVNYWWGMDSGVIDVKLSDLVPAGVRTLAETFMERLRQGGFDIFGRRLTAGDGGLISDGETPLSSMEILKMDRLLDCVEGHIPEYGEIMPMSRGLYRELGVHRESAPGAGEGE